MNLILLILSLFIVLGGALVFANGVEWLGKRLNLSHGTVGSILAAVGTAMPETMIPVIAILFGTGDAISHEIGVGAILGAPFMLSTIVLFLCGVSALAFARRRQALALAGAGRACVVECGNPVDPACNISTADDEIAAAAELAAKSDPRFLNINPAAMRRDLGFFLAVFTLAVVAGFIAAPVVKYAIATVLALAYAGYVVYTIRQGRLEFENEEECIISPLYCARQNPEPPLALILLQVALALAAIIIGAKIFVNSTHSLAVVLGVPALILALIIAPLTTELPETCNSFWWISCGKDTLALNNITGAMILQSSLLPALGIAFTDWQFTPAALTSSVLALLAAALVFLQVVVKKRISPAMLLVSGVFYFAFIVLVMLQVI